MQRPKIKGVEVGELLDIKSANAETGVMAGYLSKFWVVDSYGEAMAPGSFATSIAERGPKGADRILARYEHAVTVGKATDLKEDADGLWFEAKISDDGAEGTQLRRHLADGIPYGLSVGFYRRATRPATEDDPLIWDHAPAWVKRLVLDDGDVSAVTIHTDAKLVEGSAVSFPAVDNAVVESYRADYISSLLTDLKAGRLSDEERAALKELADAWLADVGARTQRDAAAEPEPRTVLQCHDYDAALLLVEIERLGINLGVHA
jgi:HK97 family phage prohead protease